MNGSHFGGTASSGKIASTGHSGSHAPQSMHSSGSMTSMRSVSWMQSTGQTSTQERSFVSMQGSVMMYVTRGVYPSLLPAPQRYGRHDEAPAGASEPRQTVEPEALQEAVDRHVEPPEPVEEEQQADRHEHRPGDRPDGGLPVADPAEGAHRVPVRRADREERQREARGV